MEFVALDDGVYDVVHVPDDKLQEGEPNTPPAFPSLQVIVPVGIFCEFDVSATVAVNVMAVPITKDGELEVTVTDVKS